MNAGTRLFKVPISEHSISFTLWFKKRKKFWGPVVDQKPGDFSFSVSSLSDSQIVTDATETCYCDAAHCHRTKVVKCTEVADKLKARKSGFILSLCWKRTHYEIMFKKKDGLYLKEELTAQRKRCFLLSFSPVSELLWIQNPWVVSHWKDPNS